MTDPLIMLMSPTKIHDCPQLSFENWGVGVMRPQKVIWHNLYNLLQNNCKKGSVKA